MRDDPFAKLGALDQKLFTSSLPRGEQELYSTKQTQQPAKKPASKPISETVVGAKNAEQEETTIQSISQREEVKKEVSKEVSKEVKKFTSKLVDIPSDPPVNKVGYYFTKREMDQLDNLVTKLKPILRDKFNIKVTKNEIIRACLAIGINDWEVNQLTSELVYLLTSK